ncbi:MAG: DUF427 domain-containing protein [Parvibaculaceae bacterium]|nr:DUF427 domain-containing protein [Parvibaculaceae bacterium]
MVDDVVTHKDVSIAPYRGQAVARLNGKEIMSSQEALVLREGAAPALIYFPMKDVPAGLLRPTDHTSFCPKKGHASYWDVISEGDTLKNAVWGYPDPISEVGLLAHYISFYPNLVEIEAPGI